MVYWPQRPGPQLPMETTFSPWIQDDLANWAALTRPEYLVRVPGRSILYTQNETSDAVYLMRRGRARMLFFTNEGEEKVLLFLLPGALFGETACLEGTTSLFHAETLTDCELYRIPQDAFLKALAADPAMNERVLRLMAHKNHVLAAQLITTAFDDARVRVARTLLQMADLFGRAEGGRVRLDLPVTQQDIANLVKATRLTVGKALREFTAAGWLEKKNGRYWLLDRPALERVAETGSMNE